MSVSFDQLKSMVVFAQVVQHGSLASAARHLGLSRAVVSYHVKRLEKQLVVKLLNRSTRSMSLTDAGKQYYKSCRLIAEEAETANLRIENLRDEPEGKLKITCSVNIGLRVIVPVLTEFRVLYPLIEIDLILSDDVVDIVQEGIDIAIRGAPLEDSDLKATLLAEMQTHICASPAYLKKHGRPKTAEDLAEHRWVYYHKLPKHIVVNKGQRQYSVQIQGPVSTNNAAARTAFVEAGEGLGRIPEYDARPGINDGRLEILLPEYTLPSINFYSVFSSGATSSMKVSLLVEFLKKRFKKNPY